MELRDIDSLRTQVDQAYGRWRACVEDLSGPGFDAAAKEAAQEECRKLQAAYETAQSALEKARNRP